MCILLYKSDYNKESILATVYNPVLKTVANLQLYIIPFVQLQIKIWNIGKSRNLRNCI